MNVKTILKRRFAMIILTILIITVSRAKADFIFGTPTNLGPTVNSISNEQAPDISADGLELYFSEYQGAPYRAGGQGQSDIWVTTRQTKDDPWDIPVNLGPVVNSSVRDEHPSISSDGLSLYFGSNRAGGRGAEDLWVITRETKDSPWGEPINLGSTVNSTYPDWDPDISADGLSLYFADYLSPRPGGHGEWDIYVATRSTLSDPWSRPVNIGQIINSSAIDSCPNISIDGLVFFFTSTRSGGFGGADIWVTRRETQDAEWEPPVNLGPSVNTSSFDAMQSISSDGDILYFCSDRPGGSGNVDLWQVSIEPVCDFNNDNKVDLADMHIMVDNWGRNYPLCDIGPTPFGDGVVDIHDMMVLAEHLYRFAAHWKLDEAGGDIATDNAGDYDGILIGNPFWQPANGVVGGSLLLDGIDDYIETPFILDPSKGSFSVFAWVYSWTQGQVIVSQKGQSGGTWLGTNPSDGKLISRFSDESFGALFSDSVITDFQWHHVGLVYDMDSLHRLLYVDGVLVAEDATAVSGMPSDGGLYIGASKDLEAGTFFSGMIDDIRIYNQALTAEEIEALAN